MPEKLRIEKLTLKAGPTPGSPGHSFDVPNLTILVGPNNSGKSLTLREIESWCVGEDIEFKLLAELDLALPDSADDMLSMLRTRKAAPKKDQVVPAGHFSVARPGIQSNQIESYSISEDSVRQWFAQKHKNLRRVFAKLFTLRLDGRTRFGLVDAKPSGPLENDPNNHLWALFVNDDAREQVRRFTEEAFGKHLVVDPTGMTQFRLRLSDRKPQSKAEEQGLDEDSRAFHAAAPLVSDLGDGVRTSIGLVSAVMSLPDRIILIDEPEAFLHPTLSRRVGRFLTLVARKRDASLVVATHSADFLMGCVQADPVLRLVRLTFSDGEATARSLAPDEVLSLMNDPLLRSANALRALFHRGVVVTEADADRALYEEINTRLLIRGQGIEDALFMNAQNWQTIPRIVEPLRSLGIPAVAVYDFDVIMDDDFKRIWPTLHYEGDIQSLMDTRLEIKAMMEAKGREVCKDQGVVLFSDDDRKKIDNFLLEMGNHGIYFNPVGELEGWLSGAGMQKTKNKPRWLTDAFEKLGSDPNSSTYLLPSNDDVWAFVNAMENWIDDPKRLGIPA